MNIFLKFRSRAFLCIYILINVSFCRDIVLRKQKKLNHHSTKVSIVAHILWKSSHLAIHALLFSLIPFIVDEINIH